ncbi:flavin-containing monooxygenase [Marinobacter sp. F3R08]|uniref:flavin-containing monooxygenase n=1 Tax=Marinobacter sp. F3R08 TaxID=2841559 RepID=UPI001C09331F|nr:NAD(P)/FAD-dependent oxidoreductase [Marinobacter sp. F3R08]MBU2955962.1 NAD(P)/FAD-dependent oxidoreductase [Marinobacter sp. F3R08]
MTHNSTSGRPSVLIIGSGFGGLGMAIKLKQASFTDFTLLEKSDRVGGTWRDNTYPGAACDVQSHLYSYSFEPKHDWSRKFGLQQEILGYMERCVEKYRLADHIRFHAEVQQATFDEPSNQWTVTLANGEQLTANVLITATGQLNQPAWPRLNGLEQFTGKVFHSARWAHDYDLSGKRVAVIGTGASAIQFVPEIAPKVARLDLFQRSGAWVLPKPDRAFKRWEHTLFRRIPVWDRLYRYLIYWKNESRALAFTRFRWLLEFRARQSKRDAQRLVTDSTKLKHIIPDYSFGCKRILISNDWYPAINRSNVNLVTNPIDRIDETGVFTSDGHHHAVDAIICGTGFRASEFLSPIQITGRGGKSLNEAWQTGAAAFKGITVSGFPNMFMLYGPNTNLAHNSILYMLESQFHYVLGCLESLEQYPHSAMDVRQDRQDRFTHVVQQSLKNKVWSSGCTSWYLDANGRNTINWPGFTFTYRFATRRVDTADYQFLYPETPN